MKNTVKNFVRGCGVLALLLGGSAVSEAAPIQLINGASKVDLCLPGDACGTTYGLSNWIADGTPVVGFQQWFTGWIVSSPIGDISWSGALDTLSAPSSSHTATKATVAFFDTSQKVGITIAYELAQLGGISHILETITVNNASDSFLYAGITDGMDVNAGPSYVDTLWGHTVNSLLASADYTTPEPMSMVLLGTGLLAVARSRRRNAVTMA